MSVKPFIQYLKSQRDTDTVKTYYQMLKGFAKYLNEKGKKLDDFTPIDVEMYMSTLKPRTANVFLSAIRRYARFKASMAIDQDSFIYEQRRMNSLYNIKPKKIKKVIKKEALSTSEVGKLLDLVRHDKPLYIATVFHFYFGMRPVEAVTHFVKGKIDWNNKYMIIVTAKAGHERILPWAEVLDPYIRGWYTLAKNIARYRRPQEWYTKHIRLYSKQMNVRLTAKTARKTFETQMRKRGVEQWKINFLMGHTVDIPSIYTDWTEVLEELREVMEEEHYLLDLLEG